MSATARQLDLLEPPTRIPGKRIVPPFRHESFTSEAASEKIAPSFKGNMAICYQAIVKSAHRGGCTRKQIAEWHFDGMQNYVTGPVDRLLKDSLVYEVPEKDEAGVIQRHHKTGEIVPKRFDGSALLMPVRGEAV